MTMIQDISRRRFGLLLTMLLMLVSCSRTDPDFDAEADIKRGNIRLISYGFQLFDANELKVKRKIDSLDMSYGFYTENRGCGDVSERMLMAEQYNKMMILFLGKKNGKHWYENYQRQVDSLLQTKLKSD